MFRLIWSHEDLSCRLLLNFFEEAVVFLLDLGLDGTAVSPGMFSTPREVIAVAFFSWLRVFGFGAGARIIFPEVGSAVKTCGGLLKVSREATLGRSCLSEVRMVRVSPWHRLLAS